MSLLESLGDGWKHREQVSKRLYLFIVLDFILSVIGVREARLLPGQGNALLVNAISADVSDKRWR